MTRDRQATSGRQPRSGLITASLVLVIGLNPATLYLFVPAMPAIGTTFGADAATVQLSLSLALAAMMPATLLYGPFSDAFGRRPALFIAGGLIAAGSLTAMLAPSIGVLIVGRVIQAFGAAAGQVLSQSIVFDLHGDERAGPALARITAGMVAVMIVTPMAGGLLTDHIGWRSTFVVLFVIGMLLLASAWWVLPETHRTPDRASFRPTRLLRTYAGLLREPKYLGYALSVAFSMAILYAFLSAVPHLMVTLMGRSASEFGVRWVGVATAFLIGNVIAARWTLRMGRTRMIVAGGLVILGACVMLTVALWSGALTSWTIFGPAILASMALGLSLPNAEAASLGVVPAQSGAAAALKGGFVEVMSAIVLQIVGTVMDRTPYLIGLTMSVVAALALLSLLTGAVVSRRS